MRNHENRDEANGVSVGSSSRTRALYFVNFTACANELLRAACHSKEDTQFFNRSMAQAKAMGMSWVEGLEYVVQCRREALN
jgi:hypothetical protein